MNRIEFRRREKKLSQQQLGEITGIHQTRISLIERGLPPGPQQRVRIAAALDLDPATLLDEVVLPENARV